MFILPGAETLPTRTKPGTSLSFALTPLELIFLPHLCDRIIINNKVTVIGGTGRRRGIWSERGGNNDHCGCCSRDKNRIAASAAGKRKKKKKQSYK